MTWWAAGNARQPRGPQAREAQRPDRRLLGTTRAGTGPAPSQAIFIGNLVIVHGTGPTSGVFIYNGAPALGNPPQIAIVPTGVTADPYGNAIMSSKILMQGNVITESGGIFRTAATAPLIQLDGPHNAYLEYNAGAALSESIAPVATNDGLGNTVQAGFTAYGSTNTTYTQLQSGQLLFKQSIDTTGPVIKELAGSAGVLQIFSGGTGALVVPAELQFVPVVSGQGAVAILNHILELVEAPAAPSALAGVQLFASTGGHLKVVSDSLHGDSNTYGTERLIQRTTATQQFTLASATAITGLSVPLGVGSYHIRLKVFWVPSGVVGSSHTHQFSFTGTATANVNGQCWQAQAASAVQQGSLNGGTLASNLSSPTHVAFPGWTELEMDITVTAAGTLTPTITLITAGDDITTSAGTFWKIEPL